MENPKFKKTAKLNRAKALMITLAFHLVVFGFVANANGEKEWKEYVPEFVKDWIDSPDDTKEDTNKREERA